MQIGNKQIQLFICDVQTWWPVNESGPWPLLPHAATQLVDRLGNAERAQLATGTLPAICLFPSASAIPVVLKQENDKVIASPVGELPEKLKERKPFFSEPSPDVKKEHDGLPEFD